jgi:uncharacterized protein (DUF736 family)
MAEFDNTNRGVLFNNKDKKTQDNHPDYSGSINFNGVDCWLSGWIKESKDGKKFFSLSVKPKEQQARSVEQPTRKAPAKGGFEDMNEDIPF